MNFPPRVEDANAWATMAEYRSPTFKVHRTEAIANSALSNAMYEGDCAKYKLEGDAWVRVWEWHTPEVCPTCLSPYMVDDTRWNGQVYQRRAFIWSMPPWYKGPKWKSYPVCLDCYRKYEDLDGYNKQLMQDEWERGKV